MSVNEKEIREQADLAETYPNSNVLNWNEVSFEVLSSWVELFPAQSVAATKEFDVESVKQMFYVWWLKGGE